MTLSKTLMFAVNFARTAIKYGIEPFALGELVTLAQRRVSAWNHDNTTPRTTEKDEGARAKFEAKAQELGLRVEWPALHPALFKGDSKEEIRLPFPEA
jgi:hypothetical protein